jgi:hypothetical protein
MCLSHTHARTQARALLRLPIPFEDLCQTILLIFKLKWVRHIAHMGKLRNSHEILTEMPEEDRLGE